MNKPFIVRARTSSGIYSAEQLKPSELADIVVAHLLCLPGAEPGAVLTLTEDGSGVEWVAPEDEAEPDDFMGDVAD